VTATGGPSARTARSASSGPTAPLLLDSQCACAASSESCIRTRPGRSSCHDRRMCESIRHRGPDDEAPTWTATSASGMRRAQHHSIWRAGDSRSSTRTGRRSSSSTARSTTTASSRGLIAQGHLFATQGDTEVILHLYEQTGRSACSGCAACSVRHLGLCRAEAVPRPRPVRHQAALRHVRTLGNRFASELKALHVVGLAHRELDWTRSTRISSSVHPAPRHRSARFASSSRATRPCGITRGLSPGNTGTPARADPHASATWKRGSGLAGRVRPGPPGERRAVAGVLERRPRLSAVVASWSLASDAPPTRSRRSTSLRRLKCGRNDLAGRLAAAYGVTLTEVEHSPRRPGPARAITYPGRAHADESAVPHVASVAGRRRVLQGRPHRIGGDELFCGYDATSGSSSASTTRALPARCSAA